MTGVSPPDAGSTSPRACAAKVSGDNGGGGCIGPSPPSRGVAVHPRRATTRARRSRPASMASQHGTSVGLPLGGGARRFQVALEVLSRYPLIHWAPDPSAAIALSIWPAGERPCPAMRTFGTRRALRRLRMEEGRLDPRQLRWPSGCQALADRVGLAEEAVTAAEDVRAAATPVVEGLRRLLCHLPPSACASMSVCAGVAETLVSDSWPRVLRTSCYDSASIHRNRGGPGREPIMKRVSDLGGLAFMIPEWGTPFGWGQR
jgi:hypothetical protein